MGLFSNLLKKSNVFYNYGTYTSRSSPWNKDLYEQETVRSIIDCIATHAAKAEAMHVVVDDQGRIKEIKRNSPYVKLLNMKPNSFMTGYDFKYKFISQRESKTTAIAYIKWNAQSNPIIPEYIIPINYSNFEILPIQGGGYAVEFTDIEGYKNLVNIEDMVIMRKFFNNLDVAGDGNEPIYNSLSMVKASDEGLIQALTVSNKVRGLLKQKLAMLAPDAVEKSTEEFRQRFEKAAKSGGIVGVDSMEEYIPLNVTPWSANATQMKEIRSNLLRYWRVSESILTSDYNENQWRAFYEGVIEPILIQMGQAFTNACFTENEKNFGNRIIFNSSVLLNTSMQTKINILNASKEIGLFTKNQLLELFGYPPVEGGDEPQVSLNYVKASDQSKYQIGVDNDGTDQEGDQSETGETV